MQVECVSVTADEAILLLPAAPMVFVAYSNSGDNLNETLKEINMKLLTCFVLLSVLSACAGSSTGREITTQQMMSLKPGVTTLDDLKLIWGPPMSEMTGPDGRTNATWQYSTVPSISSAEKDGVRPTSRSVNLRFDENGKLIDDSTQIPSIEVGGKNHHLR
tara:strand:- start:3167 stop:3649 length:483 start_codon:yes stop_codon:yes gene_type:complete